MSTIKSIFYYILIPFQFTYGFLYFLFYSLVFEPTKKLAKLLLKDELKREKNNREFLRLSLLEKTKENEELKKKEHKYNYLVSLGHSILNSKELVYFDVTSRNEPVLISYNCHDDILGTHISLYLYKYGDHQYNPNTKIFGQIYVLRNRDSKIRINKHVIANSKDEECRYIYIQDFTSSAKKEGYGSTLLNFLFKICIELKINYVVGELSSSDNKNFSYTVPFYEKRGFRVYLSEKEQEGAIVKHLDY